MAGQSSLGLEAADDTTALDHCSSLVTAQESAIIAPPISPLLWRGTWSAGIVGTYDLVVLVRCLPRDFLPHVGKLLAPGGLVLLHHFDEEALKWGKPKKRWHVLGKGEGRQLMEAAGLKVRGGRLPGN